MPAGRFQQYFLPAGGNSFKKRKKKKTTNMSSNILLAIFIIQSYITRHTKKLTNLAYNWKRNSSTETDLNMT